MATFAVGDVHGCQDALERLLASLPLDPESDRLWLVGDLVNRGPSSLSTLRWARHTAERMGDRFVAVLGNHDLHLLSAAAGLRQPKPGDTLSEVLAASDSGELIDWLAARPLIHHEEGWTLVHAGLRPGWSRRGAERRAREVEAMLRGPRRDELLERRATSGGKRARLRRWLSVLTGLRMLDADGRLVEFTGHPDDAPAGWQPWFRYPDRRTAGERIVCGHWSALGLHREGGVLAVDTGCVWGRELTAVRLEDGEVFAVPAG